MDSSAHQQIKVGLFVAIGMTVISLSVIFLGGDKTFFKRTYELNLHLKHVQGLAKGSLVSLAGLPIGNISVIRFKKGSADLEVVLELESIFQSRLTQGARASTKTLGALGDKYIYIEPGPLDAPPLQEGTTIASDDTEDFLDILAKKSDGLTNVVDVVAELHTLLQNLNHNGRSAALMENLVAATSNLNKLLSETREVMGQVRTDAKGNSRLRETLSHLSSIMEKVDKGEGTLGALINDPTLHQKLISFLGDSPRRTYLKPLIRETIQHADPQK